MTARSWQTRITGGFALVAAQAGHIAIGPPAVLTAAVGPTTVDAACDIDVRRRGRANDGDDDPGGICPMIQDATTPGGR